MMERKVTRHREGFNAKKIWRAALFASTGLSAVLSLPAVVRAQTTIPSTTTPQGGTVVGGSASITQGAASTTINQSSERAAINWQSFDVGSGAKVQFTQPDANAIALNRVTGGDLSQINGQINANGQIVLINQSGVVFGQGAQINASNIVVSTSDIATKEFMAGNMAFTGAPRPGAKIINNGNITVKDTGLVGLIAPQVENNGMITARLGQVVLAGASAFTLDLYGDRLISLDVTKAVQAVDVGGKPVAALVTNRGLILADGGKVVLTAQDADALVTQLIDAGGTIRADSVGAQTGTISLQGVGGNISIAGNLLARGTGTGSSGGAIEVLTSGTVSVVPGAEMDASGNAGGGVIVVGTNLARARQGASDIIAPKAAAVVIAPGATLAADATGLGNAGTVTLLSSQNTAFDGLISVQGGPQGGNGGLAEISSEGVISLGGTVLATAVNGQAGEILLDPQTLVVNGNATNTGSVVSGSVTTYGNFGTATATSFVKNTDLDALNGTIILEAASLISVTAPVNSTSISALSLVSEGAISVTASIDISGSLDLDAAGSLFVGSGLTASNILLTSGTAGTDINAGVTAISGNVTLGSTGTVFEGSAGSIIATNLLSAGSIGGNASLSGNNNITTLEGFTLGGNLTLANQGGLTVGGSVSAATISLSGASLTFESGVHTGVLALSSSGTISQGAGTISAATLTGNAVSLASFTEPNAIGTLGAFSLSSGLLALKDAGSLDIAGNVTVAGGTLALGGSAINQTGGSITAGTLTSIGTIGGDVLLGSTSNSFAVLNNFNATGTLALTDAAALNIKGSVAAPTVSLSANGITLAGGTINAPVELAVGGAGGFSESAGQVFTGSLVSIGTLGNDFLAGLTGTATIAAIGNFSLATGGGGIDFYLGNATSAQITGLISAPGGGVELLGSGATETGAGAISTGELTTSLTTLSGDLLLTGNNTIALIGNQVNATGTVVLANTVSLSVNSVISGADVTLSAPTIALASGVTIAATAATPTLALASDDITVAGGNTFLAGNGTIAIAPLTASTVIDLGSASSGGTLGLPGSIISALDTTASKIIIGNGPIGTQASGIDIDGSATFGSAPVVDLSTSGTIFDNSGNLAAGTVTFGAPGGFTQTSSAGIIATLFGGDGATAANVLLVGANTIASVGSLALSASSTLALFDAGTLTISSVIDPAAVTLFGSLGLDIGTNVSATLLAIGSGGTISQSGGSITADTLVSFGTVAGDVALTSATNSIASLGTFATDGSFDLNDSTSLDIAGAVSAAGNITLSGSTLTESTGSLAATMLTTGTGSFSNDVTLVGNNSIVALGAFTLGGNLDFNDAHALDIDGTVSTPGNITLTGISVTESTGALHVNTLTTGTLSLLNGADLTGGNSIATLGNFTTSLDGVLTLKDNESLVVAGTVSLPGPNSGFTYSGAGITESSGGVIKANEFDTNGAAVTGSVLLTGANTISSIDSPGVSATGTIALNDTGSLDIEGIIAGQDIYLSAPTLSAGLSGAVAITAGSAGTLALAADAITIGTDFISFAAPAGTVAIAPLTASTIIDLGGTASSAGTLALAGTLLAAISTSTGKILIGNAAIGTQASAIDIDNAVSFGGATIVDLSTSGLISQTDGTFNAATLEFDAAGFTQTPSAAIDAAVLQGDGGAISGSVLLPGTNNLIGELTAMSLSTGTLALNDSTTLTVAGTVTAPTVSLSAPTIDVSGFLLAPTLLALGGGSISETGSITTGSLISIGTIGSATLTGANGITALGGFTLTGDLALNDTVALGINGTVTTPGVVTLTGLGVTETGALDVGTLTTGTGTLGGNVLLTGSNNVLNLAAFTVTNGGTLALNDTGSLTVGGTLSAAAATLSAASAITLASDIDAPTRLALGSGGTITQSAGIITTGSLVSDGSIGGDALLTLANSISALGNFTVGGNFRLGDAANLDVTGLVQATSAGSEIVLLDGGTITAGGTLNAPTVNLSAANSIDLAGVIDAPTLFALGGGSISQTGGTITAGSLSSGGGTITGNVSLTGTHNTIASLGSFFTDGDFTFKDTGSLDINGSVVAANIGLSAPVFSLNGNLDATVASGTLALAADAITLGAGQFITNNGTVALAPATTGYGVDIGGTAANNLDIIGSLASAFPSGNADIIIGRAFGSTASSITIDSPASFASALLQLSTSGTITDNSTLTANTLAFDAAGFVQGATGALDIALLQGDGTVLTGPVALTSTLNSIAAIGSLAAGAFNVTLYDAASLDVSGLVTAKDIYLTNSSAGGISVSSAGSLIANSGGTIGLTSDALAGTTGTISAPNGLVLITPNTPAKAIDLGGTTGGDLQLASGFIDLIGSKILQIGTGAAAIAQNNDVSIASQTLVLDGTSISFAGSLGGPTLLSLVVSGAVSQSSASTITATTLTGTAGGGITLLGTNAIGTLAAISAGGNITVDNGISLVIAGLVNAGANIITLMDKAAGILETTGGTLAASTLTTDGTTIGGAVSLANGNSIASLNGFTVAGDLIFVDSQSLAASGISATDAYLTAPGIALDGIDTGAGTLGLFSNGGVSEPGGVITAGHLIGTISAGSATLLSGNSIATLGGFTVTSGDFNLNNAIALDIAALLSASGTVTLEDAGAITELAGGQITTGTLNSGGTTIGGNVLLGNTANSIATLAGFTLAAGDTFSLADHGLLTVAGPVTAPVVTLSAQTLAITGSISAGTSLALESTGNVFETGGFISTPSLTTGGTVISGFLSLASANSIATLGGVSVTGNLTLDDGGTLTVAGPVNAANAFLSANGINVLGSLGAGLVSLASSGGIAESGVITASTLTGSSADAVSLLGGNSITTLGGFSVTSGNFGISNASALEIAGLVSAPGTITLEDAANISEIAGGTLAAAVLNSGGTTITGNVSLANINSITTLGGFTIASGDTLTLKDTTLTIAGPVVAPFATFSAASIAITGTIDATSLLALEGTGNITETGAIITPSLTSSGTTIAGNVSLTGTNTINTLGGFAIGAGDTLALDDTGLLTLAGPVHAPFATLSVDTLAVTGSFTGTTATFSAGSIDIGGSISLASLLALASTGNIRETGTGAISTGTLVSSGASINGNVRLAGSTNSIGTLGGFTIGSGDTLVLDDAGLLTVAGPVIAPIATLSAQTLAITGSISAATGLALESTGNVFETGGFISTPSLTTGGTVIGGFLSLASANSIATLGSASVTGNLTLDDGGTLTVAGPVDAANAFLTADGIAISGSLGAGLVSLASNGGITESGVITANTLTGTSADAVSLLGGNSITTLGGFSVTSGNFGVNTTIALKIAGLVSAPGTITLEGASNISEIAGGTLAAAVLNSGGTTITGNVSLANINSIATLGGFTIASGDTLTLKDTTLTIAGPVVAPFATFSAASIAITGTIDAASLLALEGTGNITEASGGFIQTPSLTSGGTTITGDVSLLQTNSITTLGGFTLSVGHTLALNDAGTLHVAGPVVAPFTTLSAGSIAIAGSIDASSQLALESTGAISETGISIIRAGILTSGGTTIAGNVTLNSTNNTIATLGGLTLASGGRLVLNDTGLLTVAGPVLAPFSTLAADTLAVTGSFSGTTATLSAGSIGITGAISLSTLLALESSGDVVENGAGVITARTLTSGGTTITGNVLLTNTHNSIGTLGGFTIGSGNTLVLNDAGLLTVTGPVAADHSTLFAGTIAIAGSLSGITETLNAGNILIEAPISVSSLLALETAGNVSESGGGVITAPTLTTGGTSIGGNVTLANTANDIGTLGGFTLSSGTLNLADEGSPSLIIGGPVVVPFATLSANTIAGTGDFSGTAATFSAGSIDIGGLISLTSRLALESTGSVTESTGTISVPTLTSGGTEIAGDVTLNGTANSIGTISPFTLAGNLILNDATDLVAGTVDATGGASLIDITTPGLLTAAGPVTTPFATLSAGSISITGALDVSQALALETNNGGVDESTGQITAGTLTSGGTTIQGTVALVNGNSIATLGSFAATGFIILDNSPSLTIAGLVSTPGALKLEQAGAITEVAGGTLAVGTLSSGSAVTGNVALGNANTIITLGSFSVGTGDTLALNDTGLLTITGPVSAPFATITSGAIEVSGLLSGSGATLNAGSIDVSGSISLGSQLALESAGNISETGGFITVPTLTSGGTAIAGNVTLADANAIGTLGAFTDTGNLALKDAGLLTVAGPVSAANAALTASGIAIPGVITTGTLALQSAGNVSESGGSIRAALLTGTLTSGNATLQGSNTIATLGAFTVAAGTLALSDTGLLTVTGPVSAPTATLNAGSITVTGGMSGGTATLAAGGIAISGAINEATVLALESTGNISEAAGGMITTPLLTSGGTAIGGTAALTGTANSIGTLGGFTANGALTLNDTGVLTVAGPVAAPVVTLFSSAIAITGQLNAASALALESTGQIIEPGGIITTPLLTSGGTTIGGNVALTAANVIGTLGAFADAGTLALTDTGLLAINGPVVAPAITLASPTIAINGFIGASSLLALESTGNINEATSALISTGTLTSGGGSIGGDVTLNSAFNSIATLGSFAADGLALNDAIALAITAPVAITGTLALLDSGNITQTGGTISAAALTSDGGTIGGGASFTMAGNNIPTLGAFGALAGLALTDAVPLNLNGNIFTGSSAPLTLLDAGQPISQSAGRVATGTLNATGANVTLGQANAIGTVGTVNATNLYINGVGGISGPVAVANAATILAPGTLPVTGNISAGSNLLLEALGGISQTGGAITTGPSGNASFIAGGDIILSSALTVADQLDLIAGGNVLHPAGLVRAGTLAGDVGGTVVTALGTVIGHGTLTNFNVSSLTTDFDTIGNFIMHDSTFALNNNGPLVIVGSLVADVITIATNGGLTLQGSDGSATRPGGGIYINSGSISPVPYFTPHPGDSIITVSNGGLVQTGVFNINSANGPPGNLFLYVSGGPVQFAAAPGQLVAPFVNIEISDADGIIAGNVNFDRVVILNALTKSVQLTGILDGLAGQAAASKGFVDPFPEPDFRFNACPIGSVNCTILPIETLPPGNPLENFDLTQRKRKKLDKGIHLPGVATRDF